MKQLILKFLKDHYGLEKAPTYCPAVIKTPTGISVSTCMCGDQCKYHKSGACAGDPVIWTDHRKVPESVRRCYTWKVEDNPNVPGKKIYVVYLKEQERLDQEPVYTKVATIGEQFSDTTAASTADLIAYTLNKQVYGLT